MVHTIKEVAHREDVDADSGRYTGHSLRGFCHCLVFLA